MLRKKRVANIESCNIYYPQKTLVLNLKDDPLSTCQQKCCKMLGLDCEAVLKLLSVRLELLSNVLCQRTETLQCVVTR